MKNTVKSEAEFNIFLNSVIGAYAHPPYIYKSKSTDNISKIFDIFSTVKEAQDD